MAEIGERRRIQADNKIHGVRYSYSALEPLKVVACATMMIDDPTYIVSSPSDRQLENFDKVRQLVQGMFPRIPRVPLTV